MAHKDQLQETAAESQINGKEKATPSQNISITNAIEVKDVTVSFKTKKGVYTDIKNINLNLKKGEIVSLIGHSGCGKSTLMNTISGMTIPTE